MTAIYFKMNPEQIVEDITELSTPKKVIILGMEFYVFPQVYPSDRFRSSIFILEAIKEMVFEKTVCDMGCGLGVIGQFALQNGAKKVTQADINPYAVKNAEANRGLHGFSHEQLQIFQSDCFSNIPKRIFEILVFNIPFHSEPFIITNPLERAFFDPGFQSLKKFLNEATAYMSSDSKIYLVFSNKGDIEEFETVLESSPFCWCLWRITNTDQEFDTRIYQLGYSND